MGADQEHGANSQGMYVLELEQTTTSLSLSAFQDLTVPAETSKN
jgi:hypothetical protein